MSAFEIMNGHLFTDPNLSLSATYEPAAGGAITVRVLVRRVQGGNNLLDTGATIPGTEMRVRKVDVARPVEGDELELADARRFRVRAARPDALGLVWELDVDPVGS